MHGFFVQHQSRIRRCIGMILIPLLCASCFLYTGFGERNLSGLLNEAVWKPYVLAGCALMLAWLVHCLNRIAYQTEKADRIRSLTVLSILIAAALLLPWSGFGSLMSDIHIAVSYAAFVWMNLLFYRWCRFYEAERNIYICLMMTSFMPALDLNFTLASTY